MSLHSVAASLTAWDRAVFHLVNDRLKSPALDVAMPLITDLGLSHVQALVVIAVAALTIYSARVTGRHGLRADWTATRTWVIPALLGIVLSGLCVQVIKRYPRDRPSWFYLKQRLAGNHTDVQVQTIKGRRPLRTSGFPSGHTATTAALAVSLACAMPTRRSRRTVALGMGGLTLLVALSRVYMADHWPLDVLGGLVLGLVVGWFSIRLCSRVGARPVEGTTA